MDSQAEAEYVLQGLEPQVLEAKVVDAEVEFEEEGHLLLAAHAKTAAL